MSKFCVSRDCVHFFSFLSLSMSMQRTLYATCKAAKLCVIYLDDDASVRLELLNKGYVNIKVRSSGKVKYSSHEDLSDETLKGPFS